MRLKIVFAALAMLIAAPVVSARLTAADALSTAPLNVISPLSRETLNNLLQYALNGMTNHKEPNMLHGDAGITQIDSVSATVSTGNSRTLKLFLLPTAKSDTVVVVIETLMTTAGPDSRLSVWDRNWQPLPKLWSEPKTSQWLAKQGKEERLTFRRNVDFIVAEYDFNPETESLTILNHTDSLLNDEQRQALSGLMFPSLRFLWTPKGFKPAK